MKKQEIKKLSKDEALKNIDKLKKDLFNFRFQKINSQEKKFVPGKSNIPLAILDLSSNAVHLNSSSIDSVKYRVRLTYLGLDYDRF